MKTISIKIPLEEYKKLVEAHHDKRQSLSEFVRDTLRKHMQKKEKKK